MYNLYILFIYSQKIMGNIDKQRIDERWNAAYVGSGLSEIPRNDPK